MTQIEDTEVLNRDIKANNLIRDVKVLNIAKYAKILVDIYGQDEPFQNVGKYEGKEIELYLKKLDGYLTFILTSDRNNFNCHAEKAKDPVARITINVKEEKIISVISDIVRSKHNLFGLVKLLKFIIPRKAKIKGSYIAAMKLVRCLMIGKHDVYKKRL